MPDQLRVPAAPDDHRVDAALRRSGRAAVSLTPPAPLAPPGAPLIRESDLWGTDSIWWGTPQWQIEAMRRFTMPEALIKRFGDRALTPDVKDEILGLAASRVYGIDPKVRRNSIPSDFVSKLKAAHLEEGRRPSLTQYGWVLDR